MQCELITDFSRLEQLAAAWRRWSVSGGRMNVFQSWSWARAFWRAYGATTALYAVAVHDGKELRGLLPLIQRGGVIEFLGSPESDANDMLCNDDIAAPVLETALAFLIDHGKEWNGGVLHNIPLDSLITRNLSKLPRGIRRHLQLVFRNYAPAIVPGEGQMRLKDGVLRGERSRRSHRRRLERRGPLGYRHFDTRAEAREHLDDFFQQHITRWAMSGVRSEFLIPERRAFCAALVEELDPVSELRFGALELAGQPIAYHFGFQSGGKLTYYRTSFRADYWSYSPGEIQLLYLLKYAWEASLEEIDFSLGDEPYKYRFANQSRELYSLYLERHPIALPAVGRRLVRRALGKARRNRVLKAALKARVEHWEEFLARQRWNSGRMRQQWLGQAQAACMRLTGRDEEVFIYSGVASAGGSECRAEIAPLTLDLLAELFVNHSKAMNKAGVDEFRARLQKGGKACVARIGSGDPYVLWLARCDEIPVPKPGATVSVPLPAPALVIEDHWTPQAGGSGPIPSAILRALIGHLTDVEIWLCCKGKPAKWRAELDQAGFQLRHRFLVSGIPGGGLAATGKAGRTGKEEALHHAAR